MAVAASGALRVVNPATLELVGTVSATDPSARRNQTHSKRHSCSHWRQPPQGDAVIAIASTPPGFRPSLAAFAIAARSAQIPSG